MDTLEHSVRGRLQGRASSVALIVRWGYPGATQHPAPQIDKWDHSTGMGGGRWGQGPTFNPLSCPGGSLCCLAPGAVGGPTSVYVPSEIAPHARLLEPQHQL